MRTAHWVWASLPLFLFFTNCAEERPQKYIQGQGLNHNLELKTNLDKQTFTLTTGEVLARAEVSRVSKPKIAENLSSLNHFDLVQYETKSPLLGKVPFRGRPNFTYEIRHELGPRLLTIYKVGHKKDLPYQEWDDAKTLEDGRLAVPLVAYDVKGFFRYENKLNDDDESTHQVMEIEERDFDKATHVFVDYHSRKALKPLQKVDVYPVSLFSGEWYFSETIIDTASKSLGDLMGEATHKNPSRVAVVKLDVSSNHLRGLDLAQDKRVLALGDEITSGTLVDIPIRRVAYRLKPEGSQLSLNEEEATDVPEEKRPYIAMDFEKVIGASVNGRDTDRVRLVDLELEAKYIGLTYVKYGEHGLVDSYRVKFSFLKKEPRNYKPRPYPRYDRFNGFGAFSILEPRISDYQVDESDEVSELIHVTRFNPEAKEIVYHFSTLTPKLPWLRNLAKTAAASWTQAFARAGVNLKVRIDETSDESLGDLRYNVLNLMDTAGAATRLLGFGPSLAEPNTGEIISATTNVHLPTVRALLVESVQQYILYSAGRVELPKDLLALKPSASPFQTFFNSFLGGTAGNRESIDPTPLHVVTREQGQLRHETLYPGGKKSHKHSFWKESLMAGDFHAQPIMCGADLSMSPQFELIEENCSTLLKKNIAEAKAGFRNNIEESNAAITACADSLLPEYALETIVHELGHNLGLRHVFSGSADAANFWVKADGVDMDKVGPSSSVMDYSGPHAKPLLIPGKMDIATLRYIYAESIEMQDGSIQKLVAGLDLEKNEKLAGKRRKPFKYCSDEHVSWQLDPMCQRFDSGSTPSEVVDNIILEFWSNYAFNYYRHGRVNFLGTDLSKRFVGRTASRLKRFYDEWRFVLADYMGRKDNYLASYDGEDFQKLLQSMATDSQFQERYRSLRPAADKAFQFLFSLAKASPLFCVTVSPKGTGAIEFETLRRNLYTSKGISISSCQDPEVASVLKAPLDSISSVGYPLEDTRFSQRPDESTSPYDIAGLYSTRVNALNHLSLRLMDAFPALEREFSPSFLDEPQYRDEVGSWLTSRVLDGIRLNAKERPLPLFESEKQILQHLFSLFRDGLSVPEQQTTSLVRGNPWAVTPTNDPSLVNQSAASYRLNAKSYLVTDEDNVYATAMLKRMEDIRNSSERVKALKDGKIPDVAVLTMTFADFANTLGKNQNPMVATMGFVQSLQEWTAMRSDLSQEEKGTLVTSLLGSRYTELEKTFAQVVKNGGRVDEETMKEALTKAEAVKNGLIELASNDEHKDLYRAVEGKLDAAITKRLRDSYAGEINHHERFRKESLAQQALLLGVLLGKE